MTIKEARMQIALGTLGLYRIFHHPIKDDKITTSSKRISTSVLAPNVALAITRINKHYGDTFIIYIWSYRDNSWFSPIPPHEKETFFNAFK